MNTTLFQEALAQMVSLHQNFVPFNEGTSLKDEWLWQIAKYIHSESNLVQQIPVFTQKGIYTVDWVLQNDKQKIGFIFTNTEHITLAQRAQDIAEESDFDAIYLLRAQDIYYHCDDLIYLFSRIHPRLFSERGRNNLQVLASFEVQNLTFGVDKMWQIRYEVNEQDEERNFWTIGAHEALISRFVASAKPALRVLKGNKKDTKAA